MAPAEHAILMDVFILSFLLLGLALLVYQFWKRSAREPALVHPGRVNTERFHVPELVTGLALVVLLYFYVNAFGSLKVTPPADPPEAPSALTIIANQILTLFVLGCVCVFLGPVRGNDIAHLFGLKRVRPAPLFVYSLLLLIPSTIITILVMQAVQHWVLQDLIGKPQPQEAILLLQKGKAGPGFVVALLVSAVIIAPVVEEVVFRGYLYPTFKKFTNPYIAALAIGGIFAAVHANVAALFPLWLFAIMLVAIYEWFGTLWVPILVHAGFNAINIGLTLLLPETAASP